MTERLIPDWMFIKSYGRIKRRPREAGGTMTIRWKPEGKVDRYPDHSEPPSWGELADALDECVAALREVRRIADWDEGERVALEAMKKIGVEQ